MQSICHPILEPPSQLTMMLQMTPASTSSGVAGLNRSEVGEYIAALLAQEQPALVLLLLPPTDTAATEQNGTQDMHGKRAGTKTAGISRPLEVPLCRVPRIGLQWCCCCCRPRTLQQTAQQEQCTLTFSYSNDSTTECLARLRTLRLQPT
jgi:hypothetical protein